jgi:hypothetical protein
MLKTLAETLGGDRACTDCARVFRLPGFFNRKYTPAILVTAEIGDAKAVYSRRDFRLETPGVGTLDASATRPRNLGESRTQSEADWKWVMSQLRAGNPAHEVVGILAAARSDKPNTAREEGDQRDGTWNQCGWSRHEPAVNYGVERRRCFAPDEL